jgi:hypothetical protein
MIEYRQTQSAVIGDTYSTILREASDFFAGQRIHMIGNGFDEILSEQSLFETYVEKLSKGLTADEAVQIGQLMENSRLQIMQESSVGGIQPIAALSMPTVRKMWVKVALKNAIPTEAVKAPKFAISYMEPYLLNGDGSKVKLPEGLRQEGNSHAEKRSLSKAAINLPAEEIDLMAPVGASKAIGDAIDPIFFVEYVTIEKADGSEEKVKVHLAADIRKNIVGEVAASDGTRDTLFATVDFVEGIFSARSLKDKIVAVELRGHLTAENNTKGQSVSFDIKTKDVTIGTGVHLNAPLPIEWLQDTMAMYQIDGALEVVDLMSNVHAQKLDQEIREFLEESFELSGSPYKAAFDVRPSAAFAGSPKDWREELKTVIDHIAIKMKNDTAFSNGKYVLIGNPLDLNLLTNVDWVFNSVTDERGGVEVDFNIGAYSGSQRYELVASANVPAGKIRMIFIPSSPKLMTYKYYPYTFNVEKGYIDPNRPNVPSIMMTKRHTIEELMPLAAEVEIINNNSNMLTNLPR